MTSFLWGFSNLHLSIVRLSEGDNRNFRVRFWKDVIQRETETPNSNTSICRDDSLGEGKQ